MDFSWAPLCFAYDGWPLMVGDNICSMNPKHQSKKNIVVNGGFMRFCQNILARPRWCLTPLEQPSDMKVFADTIFLIEK